MKQRPRIYYSDAQKELMWDRWQIGDSMRTIAGLFDRGHASVQRILSATGGIRPPPRGRSRLSLTLAEREEISLNSKVWLETDSAPKTNIKNISTFFILGCSSYSNNAKLTGTSA